MRSGPRLGFYTDALDGFDVGAEQEIIQPPGKNVGAVFLPTRETLACQRF